MTARIDNVRHPLTGKKTTIRAVGHLTWITDDGTLLHTSDIVRFSTAPFLDGFIQGFIHGLALASTAVFFSCVVIGILWWAGVIP